MNTGQDLKLLGASTLMIFICEAAASLLPQTIPPLIALAASRLVQLILLGWLVWMTPGGAAFVGLSKPRLMPGLKTGLVWSFGCGVAATGIALLLSRFQINVADLIRADLPDHKALFILTGSTVGPGVEEIYFRGILYTFLRKIGLFTAMSLSALIFALFHFSGGAIPLIPLVGGLVFALSFEHSKSLVTPLLIHALGNLAIFSISLIF